MSAIEKASTKSAGPLTKNNPPAPRKPSIDAIPTNLRVKDNTITVGAELHVDLEPGPARTRSVNAMVRVTGINNHDAHPALVVKSISLYEQSTGKRVVHDVKPVALPRGAPTRDPGVDYPVRFETRDGMGELKKQYVVVVETTVNGSKPYQVRSDPTSVTGAF
jgi:hypothetical protein